MWLNLRRCFFVRIIFTATPFFSFVVLFLYSILEFFIARLSAADRPPSSVAMQQRCRPLYGEQSGEKKKYSVPSISSHLLSPDVLLLFRLLFLSSFSSIFSVSLFISILLCSQCFAAFIILSFHTHPASSPLLPHDFRPCVDVQDAFSDGVKRRILVHDYRFMNRPR